MRSRTGSKKVSNKSLPSGFTAQLVCSGAHERRRGPPRERPYGRSGRASALYSLARGGRVAVQRFEASEVGGFEAQLGDEIGALAVVCAGRWCNLAPPAANARRLRLRLRLGPSEMGR